MYAITKQARTAGSPARRSRFFAVSFVMLVGFVVWELRHPEPLMRIGILRIKTVTGANAAGFIMGTAMFAMFLMLTLYMQQVLGYSAMGDAERTWPWPCSGCSAAVSAAEAGRAVPSGTDEARPARVGRAFVFQVLVRTRSFAPSRPSCSALATSTPAQPSSRKARRSEASRTPPAA